MRHTCCIVGMSAVSDGSALPSVPGVHGAIVGRVEAVGAVAPGWVPPACPAAAATSSSTTASRPARKASSLPAILLVAILEVAFILLVFSAPPYKTRKKQLTFIVKVRDFNIFAKKCE